MGVNVNTASAPLLQHVAGLNKTTATNVVAYREENGRFASRAQLKKVSRLGPKAYEQAVGFLRIIDGKNVLDNTGIHPETYKEAKEILELAELSLAKVGSMEAKKALEKLYLALLAEQVGLGKETVKDMVQALSQPGRDLRDELAAPLLRTDV